MNRILKITAFFLCFLSSFIQAQTYSNVVSDEEIYGFLNWLTANSPKPSEEPRFKKKQIYHKILSWDSSHFFADTAKIKEYKFFVIDHKYIYQSGADTIFHLVDRDFILEQWKSIKDTLWHGKFSKSALITNKDQRRANRYYYSIPLFSKDKNYVIVRRTYYCGNTCAYGGFYIYRKLDEGWKFLYAINTWMS